MIKIIVTYETYISFKKLKNDIFRYMSGNTNMVLKHYRFTYTRFHLKKKGKKSRLSLALGETALLFITVFIVFNSALVLWQNGVKCLHLQ